MVCFCSFGMTCCPVERVVRKNAQVAKIGLTLSLSEKIFHVWKQRVLLTVLLVAPLRAKMIASNKVHAPF